MTTHIPLSPAEIQDARGRIEALNLPQASYMGIGVADGECVVSVIREEKSETIKLTTANSRRWQTIIDWLRDYAARENVKIVAATLLGQGELDQFGSRLWLEEDIVPLIITSETTVDDASVLNAARHAEKRFDDLHLPQVQISNTNEVHGWMLATTNEYKKTVPPDVWKYFEQEVATFKRLKNRLMFLNATPQGGGVAIMRHALLRIYQPLGVDVHWHLMEPNSEVFEITKTKFHNVLQAVAPEDTEINQADKELYLGWSRDNAERLREAITAAKVIVIDDPQPSGVTPYIAQYNPTAHVMYRSHIQLDRQLIATPDTPQHRTWQFIWNNAQPAEVFISHPVQQFIPADVADIAVTMPAVMDPLDGLNKELDNRQMDYYLRVFDKILLLHSQEPLDRNRPYLIQQARFDPAKGIPDVIEAYKQLREKLPKDFDRTPQLVITGHGSIDDPDGVPVYNMALELIHSDRYRQYAHDIKILRLHHNDQLLNALLRGSYAVLQLSHREGFEHKVTEALHKGKPVIAYRAGGIPVQIEDGTTGFVIEVGDCAAVSERLYQLLTDEQLYQKMSTAAAKNLNPNFTAVYNALKWLYLANRLAAREKITGQSRSLIELIGDPLTSHKQS